MNLSIPERLTLIFLCILLIAGALILHFRRTPAPHPITIEHNGIKQVMTLTDAEKLIREKLKVNMNAASVDKLTNIPGIGKGLAAEIAAYRENGGVFVIEEDLLRIHGIGPKKLEKMRGYVKFN